MNLIETAVGQVRLTIDFSVVVPRRPDLNLLAEKSRQFTKDFDTIGQALQWLQEKFSG